MATHTIQIFNQSGFSKSYGLFMRPPSGDGPEAFINAWVTFPNMTTGSFDSVTYDDALYAFWGVTDQLSPGTVVQSGGVARVNVATSDSVPFSGGEPIGFGPVQSPGRGPAGAFTIIAAGDFTPDAGYVFGVAKGAKTPIPVPVMTVPGQPNMTYSFMPGSKIYVVDGHFAPGALHAAADVADRGAVEIDFSGHSRTTATAVQNPTGVWTISYS